MREVPGFVGSHNPQLSALRISDPDKFVKMTVAAIKLNNGNVRNAAEALKVHRNTLMRWIEKYSELKAAVAASR
jgi:sugar diacid utilization regulator